MTEVAHYDLYRGPKKRDDPALGGVTVDYSGGDQVFEQAIRGVHVGVAGDLHVLMADGSEVTFQSMLAGHVYPYALQKVFQAGSTAAGVALY